MGEEAGDEAGGGGGGRVEQFRERCRHRQIGEATQHPCDFARVIFSLNWDWLVAVKNTAPSFAPNTRVLRNCPVGDLSGSLRRGDGKYLGRGSWFMNRAHLPPPKPLLLLYGQTGT